MKLEPNIVNMTGNHGDCHWTTEIKDTDTGQIVGTIVHARSPAKRYVSLFGGKYEGEFTSSQSGLECEAFLKGIEAVLNHMVALPEVAAVVAA
jgi:hypothetical protein